MTQIPTAMRETNERTRKGRAVTRQRERGLVPATPCILPNGTNGTAANYRWYNLCSGYIWIYSGWCPGEGVGVLFGGPSQPEVRGDNNVKRAITYFRNVGYGYHGEVDVFVDVDN